MADKDGFSVRQKALTHALLPFCLLLPLTASAQSAATTCPQLPSAAGLSWEVIQPPGLVFCRALRSDGSEAFAVTLSEESPYRPSRSQRQERGQINGQDVWWHRSELGGSSDKIVREALLELPDDQVAHFAIIANSEDGLAQSQQWVSQLRF